MIIYFCPVDMTFRNSLWHLTIPHGSFEVSSELHALVQDQIALGKKVSLSADGKSIELVSAIPEHSKQLEENWCFNELERSRGEIEKLQDSDAGAVSSITAWRAYRKELRAWPEHKNFPSKEGRPVAPDAKE